MEDYEQVQGVAILADVSDSALLSTSEILVMRQRLLGPFSASLPRRYFAEEGDGCLAVVPDYTVDDALDFVANLSRRANSIDALKLRFRFAIHTGSFLRDQWGFTGSGANLIYRMIQAEELRRLQRTSRAMAVAGLSVAARAQTAKPREYLSTRFRVKETSADLWMTIIDPVIDEAAASPTIQK